MEQTLIKIHQHKIKTILKSLKSFLVIGILVGVMSFLLSQSIITTLIIVTITGLIIFGYYSFFWSKSYFLVTSDSISMYVRNGFFSHYDMRIHFSQIKDMAYSKNHFLHYFFNYGVMFVRTSAAADGSFIIEDIPNVEEIYKKVSYLHAIGSEERKKISGNEIFESKPVLSESELIEKNIKILQNIPGIVEVNILTSQDKQFIFTHEEDRNHGVYECIKRKVTLVATHDSSFRDADAPIVLKLGSKVIFPPVSFHEIKEKNTVSSSPGLEVHNYLVQNKLKNVGEYDATLLIGFDT